MLRKKNPEKQSAIFLDRFLNTHSKKLQTKYDKKNQTKIFNKSLSENLKGLSKPETRILSHVAEAILQRCSVRKKKCSQTSKNHN